MLRFHKREAQVIRARPPAIPIPFAPWPQAAWRGWRVRRLLAQARQLLLQGRTEVLLGAGNQHADWGLELDLELSTSSLDSLLEGGASGVLRAFDAPEALLPDVAAAAAVGMAPDPTPVWPLFGQSGSRGGSGTSSSSSSSNSSGGSGYQSTDAPSSKELQLPQLSVAQQSPGPVSSAGSDWQFDDPATAAAFMHLRQRQAAAMRKRTLQQQRRDPAARLQEFQMRNGVGLPTCPSGPCNQQQSSGGTGSGSSGRRSGQSGSGCSSLPSLRSPRAARAARRVVVGVHTVQLDG